MTETTWRRRFRAPRTGFPSWARDEAERLIYSSNADGKLELYAWDRRARTSWQLTDRPQGTRRGQLDPNGEVVWWFDDGRGSQFGAWRVVPFHGGRPEPAWPDMPPAYSAGLALGRGVAVVGSSTGEGSRIHLLRGGEAPRQVYAHREPVEVVGLAPSDDVFAVEHSEHGDSRHPALRVLDLTGGAWANLWDGPDRGLSAGPWSPVAGDRRLIVHHERRGIRQPGIWSVDDGVLTEVELDLPGEISASWYPSASALLLVHEHRGRAELYRYDLATGRLERLPSRPGHVEVARVRPDGEIWVLGSSAAIPPELTGTNGPVLDSPAARSPLGVPYSDLQVGEVHGFLAEPGGSRPHPTILLLHGGPAAHDRDAFDPRVQAWVDHGFAVGLVNYRGSTGYGLRWRDAIQGNPGLTELEDVAAIRDHLVASGIADSSRMVLAGRSWGGYLTLLGLGTQPELWTLGIAEVPVADYLAAFEDEKEELKAFDRALFGGTPAQRPDVYRERSPLTYVEQVRVPVYVSGGELDPLCPIRQIDNYIARLRELGKPHRTYRFEAGHASGVVDEQIEQLAAHLRFAAEHLGTPLPS